MRKKTRPSSPSIPGMTSAGGMVAGISIGRQELLIGCLLESCGLMMSKIGHVGLDAFRLWGLRG